MIIRIFIIILFISNPYNGLSQDGDIAFSFSGEVVPLNFPKVSYKLNIAMKQISNNIKTYNNIRYKTSFYFPYLEARLMHHGIPEDFKYLPIVESNFKNNAISKVGATGFWQIMPGTAKDLGLSVAFTKDERNSIIRSTDAACKHLLYLYKELKNWTLVAAAYNVGLGGIRGSMKRQQIKNYYFLKLNTETGDYIYRILALKAFFENIDPYSKLVKKETEKKHTFNKGTYID